MTTKMILLVLVMTSSVLSANRTAHAQSQRTCLPPDSTSSWLQRATLAIVSDTSVRAQVFRTRFGIPAGTSSSLSLVQDDATCEAVTAAVEYGGTGHFAEALVIVRIGETDPHYAATPRIERGGGVIALLDARPKLLTMIGQ